MKPNVRLFALAIAAGLQMLAFVAFSNCATTKAVVAVAKTCADDITNDVESSVFSAANAETDTTFTQWIDQAVAQFTECVVGAEAHRILTTYSTAPIDGGTTVEVIKSRKAKLSASENSIVYQRLSAWCDAHVGVCK